MHRMALVRITPNSELKDEHPNRLFRLFCMSTEAGDLIEQHPWMILPNQPATNGDYFQLRRREINIDYFMGNIKEI